MARSIVRVVPAIAVAVALGGCGRSADDHKPAASMPSSLAATVATADVAVPVTQDGTEPGSFALGIVEPVSPEEPIRIEPIAHFTGTEWVHAWPDATEPGKPFPALQDVPAEWLGRPVPRPWAIWIGEGAPINALVLNTFRQKDGCSVPLLLDLNKRAADVGRKEVSGVALSTTQAVTAVHAVGPSDGERQDPLVAATAALVERRRKAADDALLPEDNHDALSDAKLARIPVTLDYLYRPATDNRDIYYFQADQWTKPQDMEAPHVQAWGWLRRDAAGRFTAMAVQAHAGAGTEEGMLATERELPLGIIEVRGRTFWIFRVYGLESSAYDVYEITPDEIRPMLRNVGGGGC